MVSLDNIDSRQVFKKERDQEREYSDVKRTSILTCRERIGSGQEGGDRIKKLVPARRGFEKLQEHDAARRDVEHEARLGSRFSSLATVLYFFSEKSRRKEGVDIDVYSKTCY